jgi:hypothetical protein
MLSDARGQNPLSRNDCKEHDNLAPRRATAEEQQTEMDTTAAEEQDESAEGFEPSSSRDC